MLFDAYGEQLFRFCWIMLRSGDAALIAVRDTMIVAQAHAGRLRDPGLLGLWLRALARVECQRRAPSAATAAGGVPVPPAGMRDEILGCLSDPEQARYRAFAVGRVAALDAAGFPLAAAESPMARPPQGAAAEPRASGTPRPRTSSVTGVSGIVTAPFGHGFRRLIAGLLAAGAAAGAVLILSLGGLPRPGPAPAAPGAAAALPTPAAPSRAAPAVPLVPSATVVRPGPAPADRARPPARPAALAGDGDGQVPTAQDWQSLYGAAAQSPGRPPLAPGGRNPGSPAPAPPPGNVPAPSSSAPLPPSPSPVPSGSPPATQSPGPSPSDSATVSPPQTQTGTPPGPGGQPPPDAGPSSAPSPSPVAAPAPSGTPMPSWLPGGMARLGDR